jgi:hypothetical protein
LLFIGSSPLLLNAEGARLAPQNLLEKIGIVSSSTEMTGDIFYVMPPFFRITRYTAVVQNAQTDDIIVSSVIAVLLPYTPSARRQ